jgi:hypothetical protein
MVMMTVLPLLLNNSAAKDDGRCRSPERDVRNATKYGRYMDYRN